MNLKPVNRSINAVTLLRLALPGFSRPCARERLSAAELGKLRRSREREPLKAAHAHTAAATRCGISRAG